MFDDFHESTHGVGALGILLGVLVLAGFCGLGMAVMSGDLAGKGENIGTQLLDQQRRLDHVTKTLEGRKTELQALRELEIIAQKEITRHAEASQLIVEENELSAQHQKARAELAAEVDGVQQRFNTYRDIYRSNERTRAEGEILDLSETKGQKFAKSRVRKITPLNLHVMLATGPLGIPFNELPAAIQDRFQLSQEEAASYQRKLNASSAQSNRRVAEWNKLQKIKKGASARTALEAAIKKIQADATAKESYAMEQDNLAEHWEFEAKVHDRKAREAKAGGRISSSAGRSRQARKKSSMYSRRALEARSAIIQFAQDEGDYRKRLKALKK